MGEAVPLFLGDMFKTDTDSCVFCWQITPLQRVDNCLVLPYEPVLCRTCPGTLNPYARVDFGAGIWFCPLW